MATPDTNRIRAPRGSKVVAEAFLAALREIPEARQAEVAKAAQEAIRDALKMARGKVKPAPARARMVEAKPAPAKVTAKAAAAKPAAVKDVAAKPARKAAAKPVRRRAA